MNPSPLRYPGGKHKLYPYVAKLIEINDCTTYIEPFCGGAAIPLELLFHNNIKRVILNDYDYSIYCFWESVLTDTDAFSKKIFDTSITVNEWKEVFSHFMKTLFIPYIKSKYNEVNQNERKAENRCT